MPRGSVSQDNSKSDTPRQNTFARHPDPSSIDPNLGGIDVNYQAGHLEAIKAWSRFRFVRAGWFTANEAIDYID